MAGRSSACRCWSECCSTRPGPGASTTIRWLSTSTTPSPDRGGSRRRRAPQTSGSPARSADRGRSGRAARAPSRVAAAVRRARARDVRGLDGRWLAVCRQVPDPGDGCSTGRRLKSASTACACSMPRPRRAWWPRSRRRSARVTIMAWSIATSSPPTFSCAITPTTPTSSRFWISVSPNSWRAIATSSTTPRWALSSVHQPICRPSNASAIPISIIAATSTRWAWSCTR